MRIVGDITEGTEQFALDLAISGSEGGRGSATDRGQVDFTAYGEEVDLTPPADVVEAGQLGQQPPG